MELTEALKTGVGLSLGDAMSQGLQVTGLGLSIVFSVLIILMAVLYLFKVIFYKEPEKAKKSQPVKATEPVVNEVKAAGNEPDDEELIAVLTAAIAASLNTSVYNLQIKSYRRINGNGSAWNKAGVTETLNNKF